MNVNYWIPPGHDLLDLYAWDLEATDCPIHFHNQLELMLVQSGTTVVSVDFRQYILTVGDVLFLFPNRIHSKEKSEAHNIVLRFGIELCPAYKEIFENKIPSSPVLSAAGNYEEVLNLFSNIPLEYHQDEIYSSAVINGYINALVGILLRKCSLVECVYTNTTLEMNVISYCADNFRNTVTLGQVADEFGVSKYYLSHMFSQRVGVTLFNFLTTMRLNEACRLLSFGEKASYVAMASGFSSVRVFNYTFKQKYGMTPTEYRVKCCLIGRNS